MLYYCDGDNKSNSARSDFTKKKLQIIAWSIWLLPVFFRFILVFISICFSSQWGKRAELKVSQTKCEQRRMTWPRRLLEIRGGQSWHGVFVCVWVCARACASQLNSFSMHCGEVEDYRYCVALRTVSLPLHHTPSRSQPQQNVVALAFSTPGSGRGNGARGPLLPLIGADAWVSCVPAAEPNRDYVPGWWWRQK